MFLVRPTSAEHEPAWAARQVRASVVRLLPALQPARPVSNPVLETSSLGGGGGGWRRRRWGRWRWRRRRRSTGHGIRRARHLQARHVHRLERRSGHRSQGVEVGVVPARIRRAAHEERRAVVGEHHPVLLQRSEDHLVLRREAADVVARLQPEPGAHRRIRGAAGPGLVARRPDVGTGRPRGGEADDVVDLARRDLVVADEARQDRQSRGVAGRPPERAHRVRGEVSRSRRIRPSTRRRRSAGTRCTAPTAGTRRDRRRGRAGRPTSSSLPRSGRSAGPDTGRGRSRRHSRTTRAPSAACRAPSCTGCRSARRSTGPRRSRP